MKISEVFYELCRRADSPKSLGLWLRYCLAPSELATATIDPMAYVHPDDFARDYACLAFLRKYRGLETGIDLRAVALTSFSQAEKKCSETNAVLRTTRASGQLVRTGSRFLSRVQELIERVWGHPTFEDLLGDCRWGPGRSVTLVPLEAVPDQKMTEFPIRINRAAWPYFRAMIRDDINWLRALLREDVWGPVSLLDSAAQFCEESLILTVPKDAKTDRTIATEPTGLVFLQLGVGRYLRSRLKRFGIDLDDQSVNQSLARRAYLEGLATLDLASASDTVCKEVVKLLCPGDMWRILNRLRSNNYTLAGKSYPFEKFSTMGNGFTFELETVIFYAAARAACEEDPMFRREHLGVYGDDIVVPQKAAASTIMLLEDLGFIVNEAKSFVDGPFFESCGKHYFQGIDVTPPYQKKLLDDNPVEYIRTANRLIEWISRLDGEGLNMDRFWSLHNRFYATRPKHLRKVDAEGFLWMEGDGFFKLLSPQIPFKNGCYRLSYYQYGRALRREAWRGGTYAYALRKSSVTRSTLPDPSKDLKGFLEAKLLSRSEPSLGFDTLRQTDGVLRIGKRDVPAWFRG